MFISRLSMMYHACLKWRILCWVTVYLLSACQTTTRSSHDRCETGWIDLGRISTSVKPDFSKEITTMGGKKLAITWSSKGFRTLTITNDVMISTNHQRVESNAPNTVTFKIDLQKEEEVIFNIKVKKTSYMGDTFMHINLPLTQFEVPPIPGNTKLAFMDDPADGTKQRIHWNGDGQNTYLVLVYNSTHTLQTVIYNNQLCISNLRAGTTYYACITLKQSALSWICSSWTTRINLTDMDAIFHLSPRLEAKSDHQFQLFWPPPAIRKPSPLTQPTGYLVIVDKNAFQISAPWVSQQQKDQMKLQIDVICSSRKCRRPMTPILPDLPWPDYPNLRHENWIDGWNNGSLDEQGPLGLFVATINDSWPADGNVNVFPLFPYKILPFTDLSFKAKVTGSYQLLTDTQFSIRQHFAEWPKNVALNMLGLQSSSCITTSDAKNDQVIDDKTFPVLQISCKSGTTQLKQSASFRVTRGQYRRILQTPLRQDLMNCEKVKVGVISNRIIFIELHGLKWDEMLKNIQPTGYIVRICKTNNFAKCSLNPVAVHVVSVYGNKLYNNFRNNAYFRFFLRLPYEGDGELLYAVVNLLEDKDGIYAKVVRFQTQFKSCKQSCVWKMHDFNNVNQTEIRDINFPFTEDYCSPSKDVNMFCKLPVCQDLSLIGCASNVDTSQRNTTWIAVRWSESNVIVDENISGYMLLVKRLQTGECNLYTKIVNPIFISDTLQGILKVCKASPAEETSGAYLPVTTDISNEFNVTDLWAGNVYTLSIVPLTLLGDVGASWVTNVKTDTAVPCRPETLYIFARKNILQLQWRNPGLPICGFATTAEVNLIMNGTSRLTKILQLSEGASSIEMATTFESCSVYSVTMRMANSIGQSDLTASAHYIIIPYPPFSIAPIVPKFVSGSTLQVDFPFSRFCEYRIVLETGLNNYAVKNCKRIGPSNYRYTANTIYISLPEVVDGLVYNGRVYVSKKNFPVSCNTNEDKNENRSNWSSRFKILSTDATSILTVSNITALAINPSVRGEVVAGCAEIESATQPHEFYAAELQRSHHDSLGGVGGISLCLEVGWSLTQQNSNAVFGYLLKIIKTTRGVENGRSCRMMWLPCVDCMPGYTWLNSDQSVLDKMEQIFTVCNLVNKFSRKRRNVESLEDSMKEVTYQGKGLLVNQWRMMVRFNVLTFTTNQSFVNGTVEVFSLKAGNLQKIMEQNWGLRETMIITKTASITASVVVVVVIFLAILVVILFIVKKRRHKLAQRDVYSVQLLGECIDTAESPMSNLQTQLKIGIWKDPGSISLYDLVLEMGQMENDGFKKLRGEFKLLQVHATNHRRNENLTMNIGQNPTNKLRNKYQVIVPYDQNRIKLTNICSLRESNLTPGLGITDPVLSKAVEEVGELADVLSEYVNGSPIPINCPTVCPTAGDCNRLPLGGYIAAQAPIRTTIGLFWQMIWDNGVEIVVMLTRLKEREKEKCAVYWPIVSRFEEDEIKQEVFGKFKVRLQKQENGYSYIRRQLIVTNLATRNADSRNIIQLQMTRWDDFSAPRKDDFHAFISRYWDEREIIGFSRHPILVHCSAGVGRTGTFIAIDLLAQHVNSAIKHLKLNSEAVVDENDIYENWEALRETIELKSLEKYDKLTIDIFQTVLWLRKHRVSCVQHQQIRFNMQSVLPSMPINHLSIKYVQTQYIFIHDFLAFLLPRAIGQKHIYENI